MDGWGCHAVKISTIQDLDTHLCVSNGEVDALVPTVVAVCEAIEGLPKHAVEGGVHSSKGRIHTAQGCQHKTTGHQELVEW